MGSWTNGPPLSSARGNPANKHESRWARGRPFGLTRAQWQILAHLQRHEGINQSGLAEIIELEPVTVGRLVDRMEEAGWVERRADPGDRRAHRLFLTERARPMLERCRTL